MRIAICNTFGRFLGGVESYLGRLIPALADEGHQVAGLFETDSPTDRARLPAAERTWLISEVGVSQTLRELHEWRPEVIYVHGIRDNQLEQALSEVAPAVLFVHDYSATCISGAKAFAFPVMKPCSRRFGAGCLANYFPRHCGGFSPLTMLREYYRRATRLKCVRSYRFVLVASETMRQEYLRHGFTPHQLEIVRYPVALPASRSAAAEPGPGTVCANDGQRGLRSDALRLLFAGRMVPLKGGEILLHALPHVSRKLQRPVQLTLAGDGPAKARWEALGRRLCAENPLITVEFIGWLEHAALQKAAETRDLLVVPSLWPEPFGMIGSEAGNVELPAVAFASGGIPEWLHDGINGFLASADPPSAAGLALAIAKCVVDSSVYSCLRQGAKREATKYTLERHVNTLLEIFSRAVDEPLTASAE